MSLNGNLKTMPFADLLQFINANQNTGTLQVRREQILKMIFFEKGRIISSSSSDPKDYLGHFLVSQGYISEDDLRIAMEVQRSSKMLLGKILVMGGKVNEQDMVRLLKLKTEETIYSLFLWGEGEFTFYQDEFMNRLFVRISLDPQELIFEGVLRRDEWQRFREVFPNNHVVLEKLADRIPDLSNESMQVRRIYELTDGIRTIEDIGLTAHSVEYAVCKALYNLYQGGFVQVADFLEAPTQRTFGSGEYDFGDLVGMGKEKLEQGRNEEALDLLRQIQPTCEEYQRDVVPLLDRAEKETVRDIYTRVLPPERPLKLLVPFDQLSSLRLTPEEGFILSRIDGSWDVRSILSVTPLKEVDALLLIKKLLDRGIIGIK
jgi:hypothetical protein